MCCGASCVTIKTQISPPASSACLPLHTPTHTHTHKKKYIYTHRSATRQEVTPACPVPVSHNMHPSVHVCVPASVRLSAGGRLNSAGNNNWLKEIEEQKQYYWSGVRGQTEEETGQSGRVKRDVTVEQCWQLNCFLHLLSSRPSSPQRVGEKEAQTVKINVKIYFFPPSFHSTRCLPVCASGCGEPGSQLKRIFA